MSKEGNSSGNGLKRRQVEFLQALKQAGKPLTRPTLVERVNEIREGCHPTNVTSNALGDVSEDARRNREEKNKYPSLLTLKYVRMVDVDVEGKVERMYEITAAGRKALERELKKMG